MDGRTIRLVVLGDELVAGVGDPRALGWVGRVLARTPQEGLELASYTLASPAEGTEELSARWFGESARRFGDGLENRLVIGLSGRDLELGVSTARSRLNLANILDAAAQHDIPALVVGPPPGLDASLHSRLAELNAAFADATSRRRNVYVDTFTPLLHHEQWHGDLAANHGKPGQSAYGLLAWLVLHRGWFPWLGLSESAGS
ncbi:GDSL-type esterase/lipase family protein [Psychromicrobium xiongbiense]|uniref:GDSL-type esterase/lipase family protein n=1 Tax=Psychromicrobium xiongbiense TaxID=3051184 RepID=UPI0025542734|nr:GDSL-type esterase/lipase family protein [Psychromicrobium sp. YIM S02556]